MINLADGDVDAPRKIRLRLQFPEFRGADGWERVGKMMLEESISDFFHHLWRQNEFASLWHGRKLVREKPRLIECKPTFTFFVKRHVSFIIFCSINYLCRLIFHLSIVHSFFPYFMVIFCFSVRSIPHEKTAEPISCRVLRGRHVDGNRAKSNSFQSYLTVPRAYPSRADDVVIGPRSTRA